MKRSNSNSPRTRAKSRRRLVQKDHADHTEVNGTWLRMSTDIARKILDALDKMQITQVDLANRLDVSRQHVSKIIKGQENLTLETISRIEDALGIVLIIIPDNSTGPSVAQRDKNSRTLPGHLRELHKNATKVKPILYRSFDEKAQIEKKLLAKTPRAKRKAVATTLMSIFYKPARPKRPVQRQSPER